MVRGQKYRFNNTTGSSHPFRFRESSGGSTYSSGVSGSENGVQFFMVPLDAPAQLVYQCTIHGGMVGNIYIRGGSGGETNVGVITATAFVPTTGQLSHRNKFINGSFDIWQRGTSSTSTGYLADRWYFGLSGGSATCSRQEHSGSQANFSGSQYYLRLAVTSASDYLGIRQRIEGADVRTLPEGQITVSFWARGHVNANLAVWMTQNFGSGGSTDVDIAQQVTPYLQNDSTFRYYSLTFTVPSISGKTIGAGSFFQISFGQGTNNSSSAWTLDISNIQVERGPVATPFEQRSIGEELARCQRYFYRHGDLNSTRNYALMGNGMIGHNGSTDTGKIEVVAPVRMRQQPTVSVIGTDSFIIHTGGGETGTSDMIGTLASGGLWTAASSDINFWLDFGRTSGGSPNTWCCLHCLC